MNAAEEIRAAIENLERLKAESTPGPWAWWNIEGVDQGWTDNGPNLEGSSGSVIAAWGHDAWGINVSAPDAELIVTLHRTIDAQLDILELAIEFGKISHNRYTDAALTLARAINVTSA